jgi:hypothetical protein
MSPITSGDPFGPCFTVEVRETIFLPNGLIPASTKERPDTKNGLDPRVSPARSTKVQRPQIGPRPAATRPATGRTSRWEISHSPSYFSNLSWTRPITVQSAGRYSSAKALVGNQCHTVA